MVLIIAFILIAAVTAWYAISGQAAPEGSSSKIIPMHATSTLSLISTAFEDGGMIPSKYTCEGDRTINPPLAISGVPEGAVSLALIMDDPDVPTERHESGIFDHWVLFNIPPATAGIAEGEGAGTSGANTAGRNAYTGPCPPLEYMPNEHRYFFKLYALDTMLDLREGATKSEVEDAMQGHVVAQTQLMGRYKKHQ